jgi:phage FluMu protein Com
MSIVSIRCKKCEREFVSKEYHFNNYKCPFCRYYHVQEHEPTLGDLVEDALKSKAVK